MKRITLGLGAALMLLSCADISAQTAAPYAISPKWVFGNKAMIDFTTATPTQPSRSDNIIANEGAGTLCDSLKNVAIYSNNVRIAGNNFTPNGTAMSSSSSSTQGGVIIPDPANPYGRFYIITGNAEATYTAQESNDVAQAGINIYRSTKNNASVTAPTAISNLAPTGNGSLEQLVVGSDGDYGYWAIYQLGTMYNNGDPNFNSRRITTTGVAATSVSSNYITNGNWNFAVQGTIKLNRCQTLIAIVQNTKIGVFDWDRTMGQIGALRKYITGVEVDGGSKLYGCEFSLNNRYLYASTLGGSKLVVVDLNAAGTSTGLSYKTGQIASGTMQMGPDGIIYVANGLDGSPSSSVGTITNANGGGTYDPSGLPLANSSTARLGLVNLPWLNPRKPKITVASTVCGKYTFTNTFLTYFKDAIKLDKAVWDLDDGTTITNTAADGNVYNTVTKTYSSGGHKDITVTVTDNICNHEWKGTFAIDIPCTLPIKLVSFDGKSNHGAVNLNWSTSLEINNSHFEVQRSLDGKTFETIGSVKGNKNTSAVSNYMFIDNNPSGELNYYRLVQFDFDGESSISAVTSVSLNDLEIKVYPNPSEGDFNITAPSEEEATVVVTDMLGKEVFKTTLNGARSFAFGKELVNGTYILKYTTNAESKSLKLEKK